MVLGMFSLGILGPTPLLATSGIAGYLLALLFGNGLPVMAYVLLILPHGIVEIPAMILATASILRMGALMATPTPEKTVSEVIITALADWAKVMVGVVIPFLVLAAFIEVLVTPRIVIWLLF
jgi:stage II sporulation protein M